MAWLIEIDEKAKKELARLDKPIAKRIINFLRERVATRDNPRSIGDPLQGDRLGCFWRYRVGSYRIICDIQDDVLCVLVVRVAKRETVYRKK